MSDRFEERALSGGREVLTYLEGEVINPAPWIDDAIAALCPLLRRLHDATASYQPPDLAIWRPWFGREVGAPDIIGHCDAAPWNVILGRDGPSHSSIGKSLVP